MRFVVRILVSNVHTTFLPQEAAVYVRPLKSEDLEKP